MNWRYSGLALGLLLISLLPGTVSNITRALAGSSQPVTYRELADDDAETILARGDRLPLRCADVSSLELIRGISDGVAFELIEMKELLLSAYQRGESEIKSLQRVHGIGPATAKILSKYIQLDGTCSRKHAFEHTLRESVSPARTVE